MAVIGALAIGLATDHVVPGALAGGGAFFVGFGAPIELFDANPLLLCVVSLLSGAAAIAGSVAAPRLARCGGGVGAGRGLRRRGQAHA